MNEKDFNKELEKAANQFQKKIESDKLAFNSLLSEAYADLTEHAKTLANLLIEAAQIIKKQIAVYAVLHAYVLNYLGPPETEELAKQFQETVEEGETAADNLASVGVMFLREHQ